MANRPAMKLSVRKLAADSNVFEFTIAVSALRAQFRLNRDTANQLRILIEKALTAKQ